MLHCSYCNKQYIRQSALNNHILTCKFNRFCNNHNFTINNLSNENICKLLIDLHNKYEKLEKDYHEIKKFVNITKKKIDILDYLNDKYRYLTFDFNDFINQYNISLEELDIIFNKNYIDGFIQIFIKNVQYLKNKDITIPIKAFSNKEGILYIYSKDLQQWKILDDENLCKFISNIDKLILKLFLKWKIEKETTMDAEQFSNIYPIYMKKILATNYNNKNYTIKNKLFNYFKINIKNIISYEFC